ncbi:helix-turn-helix domain-containing protein [Nocardioides convexus]|uniref:helix-turn-helix domain-containing protein n=1 Tax=Nocardioides convexus TaxID=2712224 RepID=UPI0024187BDE|nr:helix-turn-helix domain-containing protein [Nocardioides convexus]
MLLPPETVAAIRTDLAVVADDVVSRIIEEVPAYEDAFSGPMGETIRGAVQVALGGFLSLISDRRGPDALAPRASAVDGAYQTRSRRGPQRAYGGRALVGVPDRGAGLLAPPVRQGRRAGYRPSHDGVLRGAWSSPTSTSLSAASVAGHRDESASEGRIRQRMVERLARHLLTGAPEATVLASAERAEWTPPSTLTAVIVPESQAGTLLRVLRRGTLVTTDLPETRRLRAAHGPRCARPAPGPAAAHRARPRRAGRPGAAVAGGARVLRPGRARRRAGPHRRHRVCTCPGWCSPPTRGRWRTCAPSSWRRWRVCARPPPRSLRETLRAWLLHQGRRDEVAAALFVHPQTIRYRMNQAPRACTASVWTIPIACSP